MEKSKIFISLLLVVAILVFNIPFTYAASVTWTQTDWSGGSGQSAWSDATMYDAAGGESVWDTTAGQVKMKINATNVVGQANMTSSTDRTANTGVSGYSMNSPFGRTMIVGTKLIVADTTNNRVLIYNTIPTAQSTGADVVIGQLNMTSGSANQGGAVAANTLNLPQDIYSDGTKLFIADSSNNRVLIYNTIPTTNNASADIVIGQSDMTSNSVNQGGTATANTLRAPTKLYILGTKLFIVDSNNNRVLIFDTVPVTDNASANVVIGQPDMVSAVANNGGVGANTLRYPSGIYSDGTKLFISDRVNSRLLIYNTIPIANNASADVVVGQSNMTGVSVNQGGAVAANTLNLPQGIYSDGTKLFVADSGNSRVLVYNTIPLTSNASANIVIGQSNMTSGNSNRGGTAASNTLSYPDGVFSDGTKLLVTDRNNSRILVYNTVPTSDGVSANIAVGQPTLTGSTANNTFTVGAANYLRYPASSIIVGTKLIIADYYAHRVLIYNTIPTSDDASADVVVGQSNMAGTSSNQGGSVAANTLSFPAGVYSDGTKLFVADVGNSRVLIYNTIPTSNNVSADVVVGQQNLTTVASEAPAANTLNAPIAVFSDGVKLFVTDTNNNRVLIYNTIPTSDDASADVVIGQSDMVSSYPNRDPAYFMSGLTPAANTLSYPVGVFSDGTKLFITDAYNSRVLIYNTIPTSDDASADVVIGQPDFIRCSPNQGTDQDGAGDCTFDGSGTVGANTLSFGLTGLGGVYSDGTKLFVADSGNNRVLVYNTIPTANNASADMVIGHGDMISADAGTTAQKLSTVSGVFSNSSKTIVSDYNNNRILIFSGSHTSTLTSSTYTADASYYWGPLTYNGTTPTNTAISFEVTTDGGSTWTPVTNYTTQVFGPSTTIAYRATLSNTDGVSTPTLTDVTIEGNLVPTVTTSPTTSISRTSATLNGEITATGGADATTRGFEYGLTTSYGETITQSSGPYSTGTFDYTLSDLNCNTAYHYRAYATNIAGTSYGSDDSFITSSCLVSGGGGGGSTKPPTPSPVTPPPIITLPPTPSTTTSSPCFAVKTLRRGNKGTEVKCLQTRLNLKQNSNLLVDGLFGPKTKAAVITFQKLHNLVPDGIVGPLTRGVINK